MKTLIATRTRRVGWTMFTFVLTTCVVVLVLQRMEVDEFSQLTSKDIMVRLFGLPALLALSVLMFTTACATRLESKDAQVATASPSEKPVKAFAAQVVGLQWLNPLQRKDYSTEWQLLWTLGLVQPNKDDDMVKLNPKKYSTLQSIGIIAYANRGRQTFKGFSQQYFESIINLFHDIYFSNSKYFYNAHSLDNHKNWRELAGIHVEYALPAGKLDPLEAASFSCDYIRKLFNIGNPNFPTTWSRDTLPDVHVTMGGANAGFTSLSAGLDYLQAHPTETVWVMNWDAPNFPKDAQINENLVLLVLAGPDFNTERDPLAWIGYPATLNVSDFPSAQKGEPRRVVQAWKATLDAAALNANKQATDIGYVIHDAGHAQAASSERIGALAETLTTELPEFDFMKQTFNTPALLGDMGAGTALTDVALGIAYANHLGKTVLVAGTTDAERPTAVMVVPPANGRPIDPNQDWFRARGGNDAYLPWWGLRHDAKYRGQGYSE